MITSFFPLAVVGQPLFGNQWLALLAMLGLIAVFIFAVAGVGRWLAATHPDDPPREKNAVVTSDPGVPPPEVIAIIAAAVATSLGEKARVVAIKLTESAPSVEMLMQQWSMEGRRQIYSSHKVR